MTKQLFNGLLVLAALFSSLPLRAQETTTSEEVPTAVETVLVPMIQPLPDYSAVWLDGRVSFVGGELSTSERQRQFAEATQVQFYRTEAGYAEAIQSGTLVRLQHPALEVAARRPYVLRSTADFIYGIAGMFGESGCGQLRINDATRLITERPPNGSPHSVHPAGMALDLRVINLSERCYAVLSELLYEAERDRRADVTREWKPEHFHVVVIPNETPRRMWLEATYATEEESDQGK